MTDVPLRYCSWPIAAPKSYIMFGSQLITTVSAEGQHVTSLTPSATPCGSEERDTEYRASEGGRKGEGGRGRNVNFERTNGVQREIPLQRP
jgi:hypothetical protein